MRFLIILAALFLILLAIGTGGCAVLGFSMIMLPQDAEILWLPLSGVAVAGLSIWGAVALFRSLRR